MTRTNAKRRLGRALPGVLAGGALSLALAACLGPDPQSGGVPADPLIVSETSAGAAAARPARIATDTAAARAAALADIRGRAEAAERAPYPDVFLPSQTARLAERDEPRSVDEAGAITAELGAIAARREGPVSPAELARMDARARELRRLAAQAEAGRMRK